MDTSETYIKMCEKAEEIQELHKYKLRKDSKKKYHNWEDGDYYYNGQRVDIAFNCDDDNYSKPYKDKESIIWLPRQDQLQEMIGDYSDCSDIIECTGFDYSDSANSDSPDRVYSYLLYESKSFEMFWLKVVMHKKYNKTWDGEDWLSPPERLDS